MFGLLIMVHFLFIIILLFKLELNFMKSMDFKLMKHLKIIIMILSQGMLMFLLNKYNDKFLNKIKKKWDFNLFLKQLKIKKNFFNKFKNSKMVLFSQSKFIL